MYYWYSNLVPIVNFTHTSYGITGRMLSSGRWVSPQRLGHERPGSFVHNRSTLPKETTTMKKLPCLVAMWGAYPMGGTPAWLCSYVFIGENSKMGWHWIGKNPGESEHFGDANHCCMITQLSCWNLLRGRSIACIHKGRLWVTLAIICRQPNQPWVINHQCQPQSFDNKLIINHHQPQIG